MTYRRWHCGKTLALNQTHSGGINLITIFHIRKRCQHSTRQELLPSLYIVEHQQLQALHKEFCQQLVGTRYLGLGGLKGQKLPFHNESHKQESCSSPVSSSPFSPSSIHPTLLVNSLVTVHTTLLSSSIPQATPSSFNMLAELEAIQHKRDEAAQQNEAPVAGSVEGQSVPVKIKTLVGKVV
ncbi:hypothetical protein EMCRGX_G016451 [Ephydatia muelleri]